MLWFRGIFVTFCARLHLSSSGKMSLGKGQKQRGHKTFRSVDTGWKYYNSVSALRHFCFVFLGITAALGCFQCVKPIQQCQHCHFPHLSSRDEPWKEQEWDDFQNRNIKIEWNVLDFFIRRVLQPNSGEFLEFLFMFRFQQLKKLLSRYCLFYIPWKETQTWFFFLSYH